MPIPRWLEASVASTNVWRMVESREWRSVTLVEYSIVDISSLLKCSHMGPKWIKFFRYIYIYIHTQFPRSITLISSFSFLSIAADLPAGTCTILSISWTSFWTFETVFCGGFCGKQSQRLADPTPTCLRWVFLNLRFFSLDWLCYIFGLIWYFGALGFDDFAGFEKIVILRFLIFGF